MLKYTKKNVVSVEDWDSLVQEIYGKPYSFQQQEGCRDRGVFELNIPSDYEDFERDSVPEIINGKVMGVSFEAWKKRDPTAPVGNCTESWEISMFWERNFYPTIHVVANDLHAQGKIEEGAYLIEIDW